LSQWVACLSFKICALVSKIFFTLVINIVSNIDNLFYLFYNVSKLQCINASCHHALYSVIIMNLIIYMYFVRRGRWRKVDFHNYINKRLSCFWVHGYCRVAINVSKNINLLFTCGAQTIHSMYHHFITHNK
jgi:hypothetical protein